MKEKESKSTSHFRWSLLKSTLRIIGSIAFMYSNIYISGIMFLIAELFGIIEEI
jgi:hypothetical protein